MLSALFTGVVHLIPHSLCPLFLCVSKSQNTEAQWTRRKHLMTEFFFLWGWNSHVIALTNNLVGIDELKINRNQNLACRQIWTSNLMNEKYVRRITPLVIQNFDLCKFFLICFKDGVYPTHNIQSAYGWNKRGVRKELPANAGGVRLNLSGSRQW